MRKKISFPLIAIILLFLVIPIAFWFFSTKRVSDDVKGVETDFSGLVVKVVSKNGSWDMFKYLCENRDQCAESLNSGKFLDKTSGGGGENDQFVTIKYSPDWKSYEFIKIYVESGWGSTDRVFKVSLSDSIPGSFIGKFSYGERDYETVIIPVSVFNSGFFDNAVTFYDTK